MEGRGWRIHDPFHPSHSPLPLIIPHSRLVSFIASPSLTDTPRTLRPSHSRRHIRLIVHTHPSLYPSHTRARYTPAPPTQVATCTARLLARTRPTVSTPYLRTPSLATFAPRLIQQNKTPPSHPRTYVRASYRPISSHTNLLSRHHTYAPRTHPPFPLPSPRIRDICDYP